MTIKTFLFREVCQCGKVLPSVAFANYVKKANYSSLQLLQASVNGG